MDEEIDDFGDFEDFQVPASHEPTIRNNEMLSIQKGPKKSVMLTKTDLSSSSVQCDSAKPITVKQVQQDKCDTISNTSASISVQHDTCSKKPDPKSCTASNKVGDSVGKLDETSSLQSSKIGGVSSSPQSSLYQEGRSDSTFLATKRDVIDNMAHSVNEARSCWDHHRSSKDSAVDETCDGINADRDVIRVLLRNAVDTVVEREQTEQCNLVSEEQLASTKGLPVEPKKGHEENGNTGNLSDIKDDFREFSGPEAGCDVQPLPLLTVNGITCLNEQQTIEGESIDDDFGDFDQAAFNEGFSEGFANFKAAPSPITSSVLLSCPGNTTFSDEVRPLTIDLFRATISAIFTTEDTENIDDKRHIHSETENVDGASFVASVKRDLSRCENVDNWPCVVFRYDNSMTRKGLLSALCINETPANCPRFAIDCFSKAFLQPVKQSSLFVKENSSPSMGQNPAESPNISGQEKLSDAAKEVLNKIPDLSFMKAEVLTFPTAGQAPLGIDL